MFYLFRVVHKIVNDNQVLFSDQVAIRLGWFVHVRARFEFRQFVRGLNHLIQRLASQVVFNFMRWKIRRMFKG